MTDKDELIVTTSILSFIIWGPKSAVINENDDNESILVCHAYNPVIKTIDRHYVETKITLDVQCKLLITYYIEYISIIYVYIISNVIPEHKIHNIKYKINFSLMECNKQIT